MKTTKSRSWERRGSVCATLVRCASVNWRGVLTGWRLEESFLVTIIVYAIVRLYASRGYNYVCLSATR